MMKNKLVQLLLFSFLVGKCYGIGDPGHAMIGITNRSQITIGCLAASNALDFGYPDTLLPKQSKFDTNAVSPQRRINYIPPLDSRAVYIISAYSWEHALDWDTKHGVLSVYVFSSDTLESRSWDYVRSNNRYIVRYDLESKDLNTKALGFGRDIPFPPSEEMKSVKMYPPFEVVYNEWKDRIAITTEGK